MKVVHISTDFPDVVSTAKTHAIRNLAAITAAEVEHHVYSLNRYSPGLFEFAASATGRRGSAKTVNESEEIWGVLHTQRYAAPAMGFFLKTMLERAGECIANDIERRGLKPDIIHGHKLTMEGVAARHAARLLNVPFAVSIQGNTDRKIITYRPDLRATFSEVYHEARVVYPFAPWAQAYVESCLGVRRGLTPVLPVATYADEILEPVTIGPKLLTAFHLRHHALKNFSSLVAASAELEETVDGYQLSVVGGGADADRANLQHEIEKADSPSVLLEGAVAHENMQERLNRSGGFVLVSKTETFGMVFIEALLAGTPIVYPSGCAVEGYFDEVPFAIPAASGSKGEIKEAMLRLIREEVALKTALQKWQRNGGAASFQRRAIAQTYIDGLRQATSSAAGAVGDVG